MAERVGAVLVAAGRSTRMGGVDKLWVDLHGRPVVAWSLAALADSGVVDRLALVVASDRLREARRHIRRYEIAWTVVEGGERRRDSVAAGLDALGDCEWVIVHDGARPFVTPDLVRRGLDAARATGAAVAGLPVTDTIKRVLGGDVVETLVRGELRAVQTPQVFRREMLRAALAATTEDVTDEATLLERRGTTVRVYDGDITNRKITTPDDLTAATGTLTALEEGFRHAVGPVRTSSPRVGTGFDVHAFAERRRLILGGVEIPHKRGLAGHSDGDALVHAVIDALLGAAARGDVGQWFPSNDPAHRDADSLHLLRTVVAALVSENWEIGNVDVTVIAERPRLAEHVPSMRANLAGALGVALADVSVKATTSDRLGAIGEGRGIAAQAVALLMRTGH